jgi:hypothetical protein
MPEALRGTLAQLPLLDILNLLGNGKKSGCLSLRNGNNLGEIYFQEGEIVHAAVGVERGEEAFFSLATWGEGDFSFEPETESPEQTMTSPLEEILASAMQEVSEWKEIRQVIPDDSLVFRFSPTGESDEVSLRSKEWQVLAQIDGARSALEIAELVGLEKKGALQILARLVKDGLVQVTEGAAKPSDSMVDSDFFDRLSEEFTELMGPIGPILIDDEIEGMGKSRETFPRNHVAELVERISGSIEDESKKLHFQRIMLDILREM